jgi:hypothetical protein
VTDDDDAYSALEAFDEYVPAPEDGAEQELSSPLYTVADPAGTVSVTVFLDGRVDHVDLGPKAADLTERELADEIQVIADLARQKARSQLHTLIVEGVRVMGYDPAIMRDGLRRELDMPTPEEAAATAAEVFASRYDVDREHGDG